MMTSSQTNGLCLTENITVSYKIWSGWFQLTMRIMRIAQMATWGIPASPLTSKLTCLYRCLKSKINEMLNFFFSWNCNRSNMGHKMIKMNKTIWLTKMTKPTKMFKMTKMIKWQKWSNNQKYAQNSKHDQNPKIIKKWPKMPKKSKWSVIFSVQIENVLSVLCWFSKTSQTVVNEPKIPHSKNKICRREPIIFPSTKCQCTDMIE